MDPSADIAAAAAAGRRQALDLEVRLRASERDERRQLAARATLASGDLETRREVVEDRIHDARESLLVARLRRDIEHLARYQAAFGNSVTSACHIPVELDAVALHLVRLLDGTRTHERIARELAGIPGAPRLEDVRRHLPGSLDWLAGMGLLEG
jgi:hypothetical protein